MCVCISNSTITSIISIGLPNSWLNCLCNINYCIYIHLYIYTVYSRKFGYARTGKSVRLSDMSDLPDFHMDQCYTPHVKSSY